MRVCCLWWLLGAAIWVCCCFCYCFRLSVPRVTAATAKASTGTTAPATVAFCASRGPRSAPPVVEWFNPASSTQQQQHEKLQGWPHDPHYEGQGGRIQVEQQRQRQQQLYALDSSDVRSLLLQCNTILSVDLGARKTGLAAAVRKHRFQHGGAATAALRFPLQGQQLLQQHETAAAQEALLLDSDYSSMFTVSPLKVVAHEVDFASFLPQLHQQKQELLQPADLLVLGLPLNPCLPPHLRFQTRRVSRHLALARKLERGPKTAAAVPVLLVDESYSTWRARRRQRGYREGQKGPPRGMLHSAAACELLLELFAAADAVYCNGRVLQLGTPKGAVGACGDPTLGSGL